MWRRPSSRELIPREVVAVATIGLFGLRGTRVAPREPRPTAPCPSPAVCLVVPSAIPLVPSVDQHPLPPVSQELSGASAMRRAALAAWVLLSEAAGLGPSVAGRCGLRRQSPRFVCGSVEHASPVDNSRWQQLTARCAGPSLLVAVRFATLVRQLFGARRSPLCGVVESNVFE